MAPPPGIVEVRCAGCGEMLEVKPGLAEFACPDCGAHQALPLEFMPRRPRRALPLHGRCAPPSAAISVDAPPAIVSITPSIPAQPSEVCPWLSIQLTHVGQVQKPIHLEQTLGHHRRHSFREEPFTSSKVDTGTEIPVVGRLQNEPANHSSHRKESHINETISRPSKKKSRFVVGPAARKVRKEHPNQVVYALEAQKMPSNSSIQIDKVEDMFPNGTVTVNSKQKVVNVVVPRTIEQERTKSLNQDVDEQQAGEIPNDMVHADKVQLDFASEIENGKKSAEGSRGKQKRESKILSNSSNELPHLRQSKCLVNGSHNVVDIEPIEKIDPSSSQDLSKDQEFKRNLADSNLSSPTRCRFSDGGFNEWDGVDATNPPASYHCTPQADQFPQTQVYSPETRWTLPVANSNSWHDCDIPQENSSGVSQLDRDCAEVLLNLADMQNQEMLCDHWAKDEVMMLSHQQRKNRYLGKHTCDAARKDLANGGKLVTDINSPTKILRESVDQRAHQTEDTRDQPKRKKLFGDMLNPYLSRDSSSMAGEQRKKVRHDPSSQGGSSSHVVSGRNLRPRREKRAVEWTNDEMVEEDRAETSSEDDSDDENYRVEHHHGKGPAAADVSDGAASKGDIGVAGTHDDEDDDGDGSGSGDNGEEMVMLVPRKPHYPIRTKPIDYTVYGMTDVARRLRREDPSNVERTTTSDYRFWTRFQQDFYTMVILKKPKITLEAQYVDWKYIKEAGNQIFIQVFDACERQGIKRLMGFKRHWNRELIAQFFATIYFGYHEGERAIFWMTEGNSFYITFPDFCDLFKLENNDAHDKIHNCKPMETKEISFMYPSKTKPTEWCKVKELYTYYGVLNRMFRKTLTPHGGNTSDISHYQRNSMWYMRPGAPRFNVGDFIWEEIKYISENPLRGCSYGPYIMLIIEKVSGMSSVQKDFKHTPLRPQVPVPSPPSELATEQPIQHETQTEQQQAGTGPTGLQDRFDRCPSGQQGDPSRMHKKPFSPNKKLFNLLVGICKVQRDTLVEQQQRRIIDKKKRDSIKSLYNAMHIDPPRSPISPTVPEAEIPSLDDMV